MLFFRIVKRQGEIQYFVSGDSKCNWDEMPIASQVPLGLFQSFQRQLPDLIHSCFFTSILFLTVGDTVLFRGPVITWAGWPVLFPVVDFVSDFQTVGAPR
ncbi:MAG: hypothetical protein DMG60_06520 [Acidobacteria bacterium]|nr:MAG: hypothetical protein DMG60_06520 [Acidobacteriota bacterium]